MSHFLFYPQNKNVRYLVVFLCAILLLNVKIVFKVFILFLIFFIIAFFRNPVHHGHLLPYSPSVLTCPSYGTVTNITRGIKTYTISIFLSIFDPHGQYSPCHGFIQNIRYFQGKFHPAQLYSKTKDNEKCIITFQNTKGEIIHVTQIAGFVARRILQFYQVGDILCRGIPYGMIRFGSRVDIEIPNDYQVLVHQGQKVQGPYTPIAQKTKINT